MKQHYKTLKVAETATQEDIKLSYRILSKEFHPDKQSGSTEKQSEINAAYSILGDPQKRSDYDQAGDARQIGCDIDEMAIETICSVFTLIIKGNFNKNTLFRDSYNAISKVLFKLNDDKIALKGQKLGLEERISFLKEILQEKSEEGMTIMEKAFNNTIKELEEDINSLDLNSANLGIAIHEKALEILQENYPAEPDQEFDIESVFGERQRGILDQHHRY